MSLKLSFIPILIFVCSFSSNAQHYKLHPDLNIDTGYTVQSAYKKYIEKYPSISIAQYHPKNQVNIKADLVYHKYGKRLMHLDLYEPSSHSRKLKPAMILVHGGGWSTGDKSLLSQYALALADSGYLCICPEYRLSGEAKYPAALIDLKTSVKWLFANASKYHVDFSKVSIMGESAGGQLATLIGVTDQMNIYDDPKAFPKQKIKIHSIIDLDGVLAFIHPLSEEGGKPGKPGSGEKWFGVHYLVDSTKWIEASPLTYTGKNTAPILFLASSFPRFNAGREDMICIMNKYGIYSDKYIFEDAPHSFWLFDPWFEPTRIRILNFLEKQ
jgi:acetyl esterase/lipase